MDRNHQRLRKRWSIIYRILQPIYCVIINNLSAPPSYRNSPPICICLRPNNSLYKTLYYLTLQLETAKPQQSCPKKFHCPPSGAWMFESREKPPRMSHRNKTRLFVYVPGQCRGAGKFSNNLKSFCIVRTPGSSVRVKRIRANAFFREKKKKRRKREHNDTALHQPPSTPQVW